MRNNQTNGLVIILIILVLGIIAFVAFWPMTSDMGSAYR